VGNVCLMPARPRAGKEHPPAELMADQGVVLGPLIASAGRLRRVRRQCERLGLASDFQQARRPMRPRSGQRLQAESFDRFLSTPPAPVLAPHWPANADACAADHPPAAIVIWFCAQRRLLEGMVPLAQASGSDWFNGHLHRPIP